MVRLVLRGVMMSTIKQLLYSGPSYAALHEGYAKRGRVDDQAPIKTSSEMIIRAPVARVWELLVDLPAWPAIDPSFGKVRLSSDVKADAQVRFVLNGFPIRATFAVVEPERELTWTGVSLWFKSVDVHVLEPTADGGTRLFIAESLAGILAPLFITSERLKAQHDRWLRAFRRAAERRAGAG